MTNPAGPRPNPPQKPKPAADPNATVVGGGDLGKTVVPPAAAPRPAAARPASAPNAAAAARPAAPKPAQPMDKTVVGGDLGATVVPTRPAAARPAAPKPAAQVNKTVVGGDLGATVVPARPAAARSAANPAATAVAKAGMGQTAAAMQATLVGPNASDEAKLGKTEVGGMGSTVVAGGSANRQVAPRTASARPQEKTDEFTGQQMGKYNILRKLGQGGMGAVFLAEDTALGRRVAIKTLREELAQKADFVDRFLREARTMARLEHSNAVKVYDVGQDSGGHFVAMEFVDGKSMQAWMDQLGQLDVGDAVHVTLRAAEALKEAHAMNLVHRDIKPDNMMLTRRGAVKVADFGLAKATDEDFSMTQSGAGLGTPYYMAPEQARNAKHVDGRADIYALGITLYYFLTGKLPFPGNSAIEIVTAKEKGIFTSARKLNPAVPEKLDLVIDKMVAKSPETRFKNCDEVIRMLAGLGLESPSLSFIDAPDKVVATAGGAASQAAMGRTAMNASAAKMAAASTAGAAAAASSTAPGMWEVQTKNPQGQTILPKWTTAQVLSHLTAGTMHPEARVRKLGSKDSFLPFAQFPEFEKAAAARQIKAKADVGGGMKQQYAKLERQYRWQKFFKKIGGFFSGVFGVFGLIIYLAVVLAVIGGIGAAILYWNQLKPLLGL